MKDSNFIKEPPRVKSWGVSKPNFKDDYVIITKLEIDPFKSTTLHKHFKKNEMIKNISHDLKLNVVINNIEHILGFFETISIKPGDIHKISNKNNIKIEVLQIQFGENMSEEDKVIIMENL